MKFNATDRKVMANVAKHGFTFKGDNLFRTIRQATVCLNKLLKAGFLETAIDQFGVSYRITDAGRDAVTYPASHGLK